MDSPMKRVTTLTVNPAIDKSTRVEQVMPEKKLRCERPRREPGGGGVNVSRAIQRLGGTSMLLYLGGGPTGDILEHLLAGEGVAARKIPIRGWTRENLVVFEERSGQQFRFGMPGPEVRPEEWQECLEVLGGVDVAPDYLVASGSLAPGLPDDFYRRVAGVVVKAGSRLVVDTSGQALRELAGAEVFLIKPNIRELQDLAGRELVDEKSQVDAARQAIDHGFCSVVALSLERGGALAITADETVRVLAPTVPIRSKVGAGDSMVAGMVLAFARGMDLGDALRFGVAAGAAAVMTDGSELCRREDTERLYEELKASGNGRPV